MSTKNFNESLKRTRKEFGHARSNNLSIDAYEAKQDVIREINREIREVKNKLTAVEDATYNDPLLIAMKKGEPIDVRKDVVDKRNELLLELRNLIIKKTLFSKDKYFDLPEDFDSEIGDDIDPDDSVGDIEDMVMTEHDNIK